MTAISVKQLNMYLKSLIEGDSKLAYISVKGEISNFKSHFSSGHLYFSLKDDTSSLKCVMFKGNASRLKFSPLDGMSVICSGRVSVFERDGNYQLYVEAMAEDGKGDLMLKLEEIKKRLDKEGLFDASAKKPIPKFPKTVGVITSESGAAVRDIFNVLSRRYPLADVLFCPATVQGETAPKSLISALDKLSKTKADVIIIGRGGGSVEDLWCFNDESLARKIAECNIPVISAVGHETDFTICDFVSDLRAPTPSAAAELAVPDMAELSYNLDVFNGMIKASLYDKLSALESGLNRIKNQPCFSRPDENLTLNRSLMVDKLSDKISLLIDNKLAVSEKAFSTVAVKIDSLSPMKTLLRGYSVVIKDGNSVNSAGSLNKGDRVKITFSDGYADSIVEKTYKE